MAVSRPCPATPDAVRTSAFRSLCLGLGCLLLALALPLPGWAEEMFEYTDREGTLHFVDDPGKIPREFRSKRKTRGDMAADPGQRVTAVTISGNQVLVPVTLRYKGEETTATLLLDTGATITTVSQEIAERLQIRPEETRRALSRVAGGGVITSRQTRLASITVGPFTRYDLAVDIIPHSGPPLRFDGLLGMNFLKNYRYHIDFNTQTIEWTP